MATDTGRTAAEDEPLAAERARMVEEYRRREREVDGDRYAPWNPAEVLMRTGRARLAPRMLHRAGAFPKPGDACLEIGYGSLGWLAELLSWGLRAKDLHGIELMADRARIAQRAFPGSDLRVGDAAELPWSGRRFRLAVASTVFTSVLDPRVRRRLADEIVRVLAPGGALLWYDFRFDNPANPGVSSIGRRALRALFADLRGEIRSLALAPPLARLVAPWSHTLATALEALPFLRTHLMAVLVKPRRGAR